MPCPMSVCNKIPSISYRSGIFHFRVSPLRQAEHLVAFPTAIVEPQHDYA